MVKFNQILSMPTYLESANRNKFLYQTKQFLNRRTYNFRKD